MSAAEFHDFANLAGCQANWANHLFAAIKLAALNGKDPAKELLPINYDRAVLIAGLAEIGAYLTDGAESDAADASQRAEAAMKGGAQ